MCALSTTTTVRAATISSWMLPKPLETPKSFPPPIWSHTGCHSQTNPTSTFPAYAFATWEFDTHTHKERPKAQSIFSIEKHCHHFMNVNAVDHGRITYECPADTMTKPYYSTRELQPSFSFCVMECWYQGDLFLIITRYTLCCKLHYHRCLQIYRNYYDSGN